MRLEVRASPTRTIAIDDERARRWRDALAGGDAGGARPRTAYAATRVVMRAGYERVPHSLERPGAAAEIEEWIDWPATSALRARLDRLGLGVAEAMDTAQRFLVGWRVAARLIEETGRLALARPFIAGAGVDHVEHELALDALAPAVLEQCALVQRAGGIPIVLPLVALARAGASEEQYVRVYEAIVRGHDGPLLVHWLGEMFLPALRGYFPGRSLERILALDPEKVLGVKLSLLDAEREVRLRRALRRSGQVVMTGDDHHFARLLCGGDAESADARVAPVEGWRRTGGLALALGDFSHALLGVLDAIALPASAALERIAAGDGAGAMEILAPCEALGRALFEPPTAHYKAGLAFLAWLEGVQENAMLADHEERARDRDHYLRVADLAARAGLFTDAARTAERLERWLRGEGA